MPINKDTALHYVWGNNFDAWDLMDHDDLTIKQLKMPAHSIESMHYHQTAKQFFYVLKGSAKFRMNQTIISLNQNDGIEVLPNIPHQMINESDDDLELLVVSKPSANKDKIMLAE
jgi:mannose-6-phosphate isomerase-like protein (cupin superfamily)